MSKNRKKIVNKFEGLMEERAEGYAFANSDSLFYSKKYRTFVRKGIDSEKTFILGCGGAGVEPLYIGFVGFGGLGATSLMELFLVMRRVSKRLEQMNVIITSSKVGEFHAVQETKGFHISIIRLNKELERLLNYPIVTPHFTNITSGLFMEKYLRS